MANKDKDHKKLKTVGKSYIIIYDEYPHDYYEHGNKYIYFLQFFSFVLHNYHSTFNLNQSLSFC